MVNIFHRAKIVLNIHMDEDLAYKANMRVFEATGSGAFILTDKAYGIERMFDAGEELVIYEGVERLIKLVRHYLGTEDERGEILSKAQEKAYSEHTYEHRVKELLRRVL